MSQTEQESSRSFPWRWIALGLVGVTVLLVLLEGIFSIGHGVVQTWQQAQPVPLAHRQTDHDGQLGWVIEDDLQARDFYGAWHPLTTRSDSRRITGDELVSANAEGKRLLCLGGSATFGVGVGDLQTWCARLGLGSSAYAAVNLGQPAYGPGQAYLYYKNQVGKPHDLVLFVISGPGLSRLLAARHQGFPKPRLARDEHGELVVSNTPLPLRPFLWPWGTANAANLSQIHLLKPWFIEGQAPEQASGTGALARVIILGEILVEMRKLTDERDARLVVMYIPGRNGVRTSIHSGVRRFLTQELKTLKVPFIDLGLAAHSLPPPQQTALFDRTDNLSAFGHQWVAQSISDELAGMDGMTDLGADVRPWRVRYYKDPEYRKLTGQGWETQLAFDWAGGAPLAKMPTDGFSVIFDSCLTTQQVTQARFRLEARGSAALAINRQAILETGAGEVVLPRTNMVELPAGTHHIRLRFVDLHGNAAIRLLGQFDDGVIRPLGPAQLHPPTLMSGGLVCSEPETE